MELFSAANYPPNGTGAAVHPASFVPLDLTVVCNTPDDEIFANVRHNSRRDIPILRDEQPAHSGVAVLVGGGPSLVDTLPEIVMRQRSGQKIFALNGTAKWLAERGVTADFHVVMDPREKNIEFVEDSPARAFYLASQCHPSLFDVVKDADVTLFHAASEGIDQYVEGNPITICGGITIGLSAMSLAYVLGYRDCHLFGYDSSDRDGEAHAYPQGESEPERRRMEIWCCGRTFYGQPALIAQAEAFPRWARLLADAGMVIGVHGSGLLPTIAHEMVRLAESKGE